ncbi:MAG TPA: CBS domain-containing protein [candidate division Zixibacteria bacterium]|nr:CBS domain-containing protein [candidate division Zixibacteria bacterium]
MLARDIMTKRVIAVKPLTPVKNLAKTLSEHRIGGVPVVDRNGKVVGVVSDRDLAARKGKQVKSIMSRRVIGVAEDTPVEQIAALMATRHLKRLPVLRGQKLAGIVSREDVIRAVALGDNFSIRTPIYDL